jgi:integrase/recombinase XerD
VRAPHNPASFKPRGRPCSNIMSIHLSPVAGFAPVPPLNTSTALPDWLHRHGYKPASINSIFCSLAGWTDWMQSAGFTVHDCPAGLAACTAELQAGGRVRYRRGPNNHSLASAGLFIRFLRLYGVLPPPAIPASPTDLWPLIREFRSWMRQHRGLTETTLDVYQPIIAELLTALGSEPRLYTAEALRGFALERARRHGLWRAKTVVVAVRAFLRFLGATQQGTPGMQYAIPGFASWQLSTVPRFLAADDVERVIASCPADGNGPRDKAVLLLLARLGLRAGEVARLRFADIDWAQGLFTVSGKARRQEKLPLPQEVGDALLHYVRQSRPPSLSILLRHCRPVISMSSVQRNLLTIAPSSFPGLNAKQGWRPTALPSVYRSAARTSLPP